jgi:amidase
MMIPETVYRRWDAVEMARLVGAGEVTGADLAETARALMDRYAGLNAVAYRTETAAVAGAPVDGPFAGVPFAVKELLAWPGLPWTMGSRLMATTPAPGLPAYSARLMDAGLNVVCSTTSSEFGLLGSTETALHGTTRNPWRDGLSAGGSSGGAAAMVSAGILPMAHGNDAGGSVRVPAAMTGVVGFKPSNQRCVPSAPEGPGLMALLVDHCISRSVRDSAQLLALTERTGADAVYEPVGMVPGPAADRLRIGVLIPTLLGEQPDDSVRRELGRAADLCESLGHQVDVVEPPDVDGDALRQGFFTAAALTVGEVAQMFVPMLGRAPGPEEFEPFTLELVEWASRLGPDAQSAYEKAFAAGASEYLRLFERCDVVLSPTLARPSWPVGHLAPDAGLETLIRRTGEAVGYTPIHNIAGCPAMSVPLGRHDGLPVGIHFAATPGADRRLLALAYELEEAAPWADARPDLAWLAGRD